MTIDIPFTETIDLQDLPHWSPWPARLLSLGEWSRPARTLEEVEREYDREKYAACLDHIGKYPAATPEDLRRFEFGGDLGKELCVSCGETLYRTTIGEAWHYQNDVLLSLMAPWVEAADVVCELGAGYGYYLALLQKLYPGKRYIGCDLSANAVALAEKLYAGPSCLPAGRSPIQIEQCDLASPDFTLPCGAKESVFLFSFYAYDNLPRAESALERLIALKGEQWRFCFFEPVFGWCSGSLLGHLRRAYTIANDYNRDLLTALESIRGVQIEKEEREFFGLNPLHPVSLLQWR